MIEHPNTTLTRELIAAFTRGDLQNVRGYFAADAVWELPAAVGWPASTRARRRSSGSWPKPSSSPAGRSSCK